MPALIIVSGAVAVGKTTFARYLSEKLKIPCFSKDDIKENLFDSLGSSDKDWSTKLSIASFSLLYLIAEKELSSGRSVILEANFKPQFHMESVKKLADMKNVKVLEFYLKADSEVLRKRFVAREESGQRHPGHLDKIALFRYFNSSLHAPLNFGTILEVDTNDLLNLNYEDLVKKAEEFLK